MAADFWNQSNLPHSMEVLTRATATAWDFSSVGDPEMVLVELLCFVEEEISTSKSPDGLPRSLQLSVWHANPFRSSGRPVANGRIVNGASRIGEVGASPGTPGGLMISARGRAPAIEQSFQQSTGHRCASRERWSVEA